MQKNFQQFWNRVVVGTVTASIFLTFPASTSYKLNSFEFGSGGDDGLTSSSYKMEPIAGQIAGSQSSSNYKANSGLVFVQQANTPNAPTFVNSANWYNKLKITIDTSNNPTDATYAIAISTDDFATTQYVQSDNTIGSSFGIANFRDYASWGSGSGAFIIGLARNTTYKVKVKARTGNFTESPWGPTSSAATSDLILAFDIDIGGPSDPGTTSPPYTVDLSSLSAGSVTTATNKIWVSLDTNGEAGGFVYIYDANGGLRSGALNYTITSSTTNLTSAAEGFGLQDSSVTQTSGGPLGKEVPYDGSSENVGIVNNSIRSIFNTSSSPIVGGRGSVAVKAKISTTTPASSDYTDTLTMIASASY